jgi:hypothetical protein
MRWCIPRCWRRFGAPTTGMRWGMETIRTRNRRSENSASSLGPMWPSFFVFNGTAANVLSLQALTRPFHAVLCPEFLIFIRMNAARRKNLRAANWCHCRRRREVDGGNGGACVSRNWRSASRAAAGDFDYAIDRDGDRVQASGNRSPGAVCARAEDVPAHGRGADFERGGGAETDPAAGDARSGSGCAFVWRDEERVDGRGGGGVLSSGAGEIFCLCASRGCNWRRRCATCRRRWRRC